MMSLRVQGWLLALWCVGMLVGRAAVADVGDRQRQIEADWLLQERDRQPISTRDDALGAVDGVKDGKWGFHTGLDDKPWWQVDLGRSQALVRTVIYNRCDAADRSSRLMVLLSDDGKAWRQVYQHNGTVFYGTTDGKPLVVALGGQKARFLRIQLPGSNFLHLDEVEVYGVDNPTKNIALWANADQSSLSLWSKRTVRPGSEPDNKYMLEQVLQRGKRLTADLRSAGIDTTACEKELAEVAAAAPGAKTKAERAQLWQRARWAVRTLALRNPLLDFDSILFVKRQPSSYSHMSDQYYGWWSRPGGGVCILTGLKADNPQVKCLTTSFPTGNFVDPDLSYDGKKVLFAFCKYHPEVSGIADKQTKQNVPEDAFYHVYEMNIDGTGLRQLTHGRYDDFDARYLPSGEIVFLSTRRGVFIQTGPKSAEATLNATLPDSYVRCGGDPSRPVAVYTLHVMDDNGESIRCISPFESFEWTPSIDRDGRIMYARWDYIDRNNMPYMKLWAVNPDGTNPRAVYGNLTANPYATFEARSVPASDKILLTASAHHSVTAGTLVLLDPMKSADGLDPLTRLTPEVCFPEIEGWPLTYYNSPWPLSERYYLAAWSPEPVMSQGALPGAKGCGLYLDDAFGNLELIYRDPDIGSVTPIPIKPRQKPPVIASSVDWPKSDGSFVLLDIYRGLTGVPRGSVKSLRIVGVPPKTQPNMNTPSIGITTDDPGKYVLGTVPVEADGSAYFKAPAGASFFFQALNEDGFAIQTMRTVTCVQPGETLSCVGCHEPRNSTPLTHRPMAVARGASKITVGPDGSWPLRFDRLVQPVLDRRCVECHRPDSPRKGAATFDLTAAHSYDSLINWGQPSLAQHVRQCYADGRSQVGNCEAQRSPLLAKITSEPGHYGVKLDADDVARLVTWMDTYAQRQGAFSPEQEERLRKLRLDVASLLKE